MIFTGMKNARNPAYDQPDAHELALMALATRLHRHFKLIPSTRAQRRARAAYWRRKQPAGAFPPPPPRGVCHPTPRSL